MPSVEDITRSVSSQVAQAVQRELSQGTGKMEALEKKVDAYLTRLQVNLQGAVVAGNSATPTGTIEAELRTAVADAIAQATEVQRESLVAVLGDLVNERGSSSPGGSTAGATVDTKALEEFIEGSLRVATDDIRHSVAAEIKKAMKGRAPSSISAAANDGNDSSADALADLGERLDATAIATKRTLNTIEAVQESLTEVQEQQQQATQLMLSIKELLERQRVEQPPSAAGRTAGSSALTAGGTAPDDPVLVAVEELRHSLATLSATMEVGGENLDRQLMSMAQAISASVLAAVESRTGEAVASALATIDEQVRRMAAPPSTQEHQTPTDSPTAVAQAQSTVADVDSLEANIAAAVESVLAPKLAEAVEQLREAAAPQPENQVMLAKSISDAVVAALAAAKDGSEGGTSSIEGKLELLRTELVATVERETGKSHEVNLTPMYKYVDRMLTFLKDELSAQEGSIDKKIGEAAAQLAALITAGNAAQRDAADRLATLATSDDLEQVVGKVVAAVTDVMKANLTSETASATAAASTSAEAAASTNQVVVDALALTALETANTKVTDQLAAVQDSLHALTGEQHVSLKESISRIVSANEAQTKEVTGALAKVHDALKDQAARLDDLNPAARAKQASSAAATVERVTRLHELRVSTKKHLDTITTAVHRLEQSSASSERTALLQELRGEFTALRKLREEEDAQWHDVVTPEALTQTTEASAAAAPIRMDLQHYRDELKSHVDEAGKASAAVREEVVAALAALSAQVKSSGESAADIKSLVDARMDAIEKLVTRQHEATVQRVVSELSATTAATVKEASSEQVASTVDKVAARNEQQILAKVADGFTAQVGAMKSVVAEAVRSGHEAPLARVNVEAVATETARHVERLLQEAAERTKTELAAAPSVKARVPWWWLLACSVVVCATMLLCAYYLFACFLVAFVPKPAQGRGDVAATSDDTSQPASDSTRGSSLPAVGDRSAFPGHSRGESHLASAGSNDETFKFLRRDEGRLSYSTAVAESPSKGGEGTPRVNRERRDSRSLREAIAHDMKNAKSSDPLGEVVIAVPKKAPPPNREAASDSGSSPPPAMKRAPSRQPVKARPEWVNPDVPIRHEVEAAARQQDSRRGANDDYNNAYAKEQEAAPAPAPGEYEPYRNRAAPPGNGRRTLEPTPPLPEDEYERPEMAMPPARRSASAPRRYADPQYDDYERNYFRRAPPPASAVAHAYDMPPPMVGRSREEESLMLQLEQEVRSAQEERARYTYAKQQLDREKQRFDNFRFTAQQQIDEERAELEAARIEGQRSAHKDVKVLEERYRSVSGLLSTEREANRKLMLENDSLRGQLEETTATMREQLKAHKAEVARLHREIESLTTRNADLLAMTREQQIQRLESASSASTGRSQPRSNSAAPRIRESSLPNRGQPSAEYEQQPSPAVVPVDSESDRVDMVSADVESTNDTRSNGEQYTAVAMDFTPRGSKSDAAKERRAREMEERMRREEEEMQQRRQQREREAEERRAREQEEANAALAREAAVAEERERERVRAAAQKRKETAEARKSSSTPRDMAAAPTPADDTAKSRKAAGSSQAASRSQSAAPPTSKAVAKKKSTSAASDSAGTSPSRARGTTNSSKAPSVSSRSRFRIPTRDELTGQSEPKPVEEFPSDEVASQTALGDNPNKREVLYKSGKREIHYANGTRKVVLPSGHTVLHFTNGDVKCTYPSGKSTYWYDAAQTTHTQHPDGVQVFEFNATGQTERHLVDGTKEILYPDGIFKVVKADGTDETFFPGDD